MAKLTTLSASTTIADSDIIYAVVGGVSYKMTAADFRLAMSNTPIVEIATTTRTLTASDIGKILWFTSSSAITVTVPQNTTENLAAGFNCILVQAGTGAITVVKEGADVLYSKGSLVTSNGQYSVVCPVKKASGVWFLSGDLV